MGKDLDVLDDAAELVKCEEYVHRDFYYCSRSKDVGDCGSGYYLLSFPGTFSTRLYELSIDCS